MKILLTIFLILLSVGGLYLMISGFQKQSQILVFISGILLLTPIFILIGFASVLPLIPPVALVISLLVKKKEDSKENSA